MNKIKEMRKKLGMTQEELSKKSGVSRTIISALENNKEIETTTSSLKNIAFALEKSVKEIFFT